MPVVAPYKIRLLQKYHTQIVKLKAKVVFHNIEALERGARNRDQDVARDVMYKELCDKIEASLKHDDPDEYKLLRQKLPKSRSDKTIVDSTELASYVRNNVSSEECEVEIQRRERKTGQKRKSTLPNQTISTRETSDQTPVSIIPWGENTKKLLERNQDLAVKYIEKCSKFALQTLALNENESINGLITKWLENNHTYHSQEVPFTQTLSQQFITGSPECSTSTEIRSHMVASQNIPHCEDLESQSTHTENGINSPMQTETSGQSPQCSQDIPSKSQAEKTKSICETAEAIMGDTSDVHESALPQSLTMHSLITEPLLEHSPIHHSHIETKELPGRSAVISKTNLEGVSNEFSIVSEDHSKSNEKSRKSIPVLNQKSPILSSDLNKSNSKSIQELKQNESSKTILQPISVDELPVFQIHQGRLKYKLIVSGFADETEKEILKMAYHLIRKELPRITSSLVKEKLYGSNKSRYFNIVLVNDDELFAIINYKVTENLQMGEICLMVSIHQKKGYGTILMGLVKSHLQKMGVQQIILMSSHGSVAFYKKFDFVECDYSKWKEENSSVTVTEYDEAQFMITHLETGHVYSEFDIDDFDNVVDRSGSISPIKQKSLMEARTLEEKRRKSSSGSDQNSEPKKRHKSHKFTGF